ncbi:MAG: phenylacetate--CoA ligase family protein, partial [Pseudomonadota bacterium]
LARHFAENRLPLTSLKQVLTISETLPPGLRDLCRDAWGAPVVDLYSSREAGYIALQCPESERYHIQAEGMLVEILDSEGLPCPPGACGRVVVTPLHNFAMPLLRYELGDVAEAGHPCSCGRGLPVIDRILGRRQNMLSRPDGTELWPLFSSSDIAAMLAAATIRRYQIAQVAPSRLELRVETAEPLSQAQAAALAAAVGRKFSHLFQVSVRREAALEPGPSGKFEDVVREC